MPSQHSSRSQVKNFMLAKVKKLVTLLETFETSPKSPITSLKINIYGNTAAGKTRFLYEVIRQLLEKSQKENKQVKLNDAASDFYEKINKRIERQGEKLIATSGDDVVENITIAIRNDFFSPPGAGFQLIKSLKPEDTVEFVFQDIEGEKIRDIVNLADATPEERERVNELLRSCAFFLCFFDPTYSDVPNPSKEAFGFFYKAELKRMKTLIDRIPDSKVRPADPLPILFIQTHKDILEEISSERNEIKDKAKEWFDRVYQDLCTCYKNGYGTMSGQINVKPALLDREANFLLISSIREGEVFQVIERLGEIQETVRPTIVEKPFAIFKDSKVLWVGMFLLVGFIACLLMVVNVNNGDSELTEKKVANTIKSLADFSPQNSTLDEISSFRQLLHATFEELNSPKNNNNVKKSHEKLFEEISAAVVNIAEVCCDDNLKEYDHKIELAQILADLKPERKRFNKGDNRTIDAALNNTWDSAKHCTEADLKQTIAGIRKKPSKSHSDDLKKIKKCLLDNKEKWEKLNRKIPTTSNGKKLLTEIDDVIDFCDDRLEKGIYAVSEMGVTGNIYSDGEFFPVSIGTQRNQDGTAENKKKMPYRRLKVDSDRKVKSVNNPVQYYLELNKQMPIRIQNQKEEDIYYQEVTISPDEDSLDFLGMPLVGREKLIVMDMVSSVIDISVAFTHDYDLPDWFWNSL